MKILGDVVEQSEPVYGAGNEIEEYVMPAECYENLVELFGNLQQEEII